MADVDMTVTYPDAGITIDYKAKKHMYWLNGTHVPSPSGILKVLDKPLEDYIARMSLTGAWTLLHRAGYDLPRTERIEACPWHGRRWPPTEAQQAKGRPGNIRYPPKWARDCVPGNGVCKDAGLCQFRVDLQDRKLTSRDFTGKAAVRGTGVHESLEGWAESGKVPNPQDFPPEQRGFIRGLTKWLIEWQPTFIESEAMVGSLKHGYAGRRDTVVTIDSACVPEAERARMPEAAREGGPVLMDLKTGKGVYPESHFRQLMAYEIAGRECGLAHSVGQGIIQVRKDGRFSVAWSDAEPRDFLNVLEVWRDNQRWKDYWKRGRSA